MLLAFLVRGKKGWLVLHPQYLWIQMMQDQHLPAKTQFPYKTIFCFCLYPFESTWYRLLNAYKSSFLGSEYEYPSWREWRRHKLL